MLDVEDDLTAGLEQKYARGVVARLDRRCARSDYRRFTGRLAKIVTSEPVDGQSHFAGRLSGVDDGVVLVAEGKRTHRVPLTVISRARLEVEF